MNGQPQASEASQQFHTDGTTTSSPASVGSCIEEVDGTVQHQPQQDQYPFQPAELSPTSSSSSLSPLLSQPCPTPVEAPFAVELQPITHSPASSSPFTVSHNHEQPSDLTLQSSPTPSPHSSRCGSQILPPLPDPTSLIRKSTTTTGPHGVIIHFDQGSGLQNVIKRDGARGSFSVKRERADSKDRPQQFERPTPVAVTASRSTGIVGGPTASTARPSPQPTPSLLGRDHSKASSIHASISDSKRSIQPNGGGQLKHKPIVAPPPPPTKCRQIRNVFISLRFFFLVLVVSSLVIVSVLSWDLTQNAAQHSIGLVTDDYSTVLITQIGADINRRLVAAEHVTDINRKYFAIGLLNEVTQREQMFLTMFSQINTYVADTCSSMSMTTKEGELNGLGWYIPIVSAPYMVRWDQIGPNMTETEIDPVTGALREQTAFYPNYDSTDTDWYRAANTSDPTSSGWTDPYLFKGNWFISTSRTLLNPSGGLIGVTTADMQLGFTDIIAKQLAATSSVGAQFVILNAATGNILGTSLQNFDLTATSTDPVTGEETATGVFLFDTSSPYLLQRVHQFILDETGRVVDATHPPETVYQGVTDLSGEIVVDGSKLLVTVKAFAHGVEKNPAHSIHWLFIHILDRSAIESEISSSNKKVLISVVCICVAFVVTMAALLFYAMRLISTLSVVLTSFARFEFRQHVQGGQLKSRSIFSELQEMQDAVLEMTRAFKHHLDSKHQFFGRSSHDSSPPDTPALSMHSSLPNSKGIVDQRRMSGSVAASGSLARETHLAQRTLSTSQLQVAPTSPISTANISKVTMQGEGQ